MVRHEQRVGAQRRFRASLGLHCSFFVALCAVTSVDNSMQSAQTVLLRVICAVMDP